MGRKMGFKLQAWAFAWLAFSAQVYRMAALKCWKGPSQGGGEVVECFGLLNACALTRFNIFGLDLHLPVGCWHAEARECKSGGPFLGLHGETCFCKEDLCNGKETSKTLSCYDTNYKEIKCPTGKTCSALGYKYSLGETLQWPNGCGESDSENCVKNYERPGYANVECFCKGNLCNGKGSGGRKSLRCYEETGDAIKCPERHKACAFKEYRDTDYQAHRYPIGCGEASYNYCDKVASYDSERTCFCTEALCNKAAGDGTSMSVNIKGSNELSDSTLDIESTGARQLLCYGENGDAMGCPEHLKACAFKEYLDPDNEAYNYPIGCGNASSDYCEEAAFDSETKTCFCTEDLCNKEGDVDVDTVFYSTA